MKELSLNEILSNIGHGDIIHGSGNPNIKYVKKYTKKKINNNTLLFHLDRERISGKYWKDNHDIVIITDQPKLCTNLGDQIILIKMDKLEEAYWKFIKYYRSLFNIPVIGVTGTCGKTTTKEMIAHILEEDFNVEYTWMSMNSKSVNLRYLTSIDNSTEVAVFEMPVAYPGYLRTACQYFQPQIRILLNIDVHHLADCETPEAYMKAKGEIVEGLDPINGTLILNADDVNIKKVIDVSCLNRVIYFGKNVHSHFRIMDIKYGDGGMHFTFMYDEKLYDSFVPGFGEHNVYNALAAIAAVNNVGIEIPTSINRLASFKQVKEHLEFKEGINGCTVIDDTWNSSPLSMATGLQVLKDVSNSKTSIALLGYMPQLGEGPNASEQYEKMGKKASETNVDLLIVVGKEAEEIGKAASKFGMDSNNIHYCNSGDEVYEMIKPHLNENTVILLKITHRVMKQTSFKELRNKLIQ